MSRCIEIKAEEVRRVRWALKLTQTQLAEKLGCTRRTIIRGEKRGLERPWSGWGPRGEFGKRWAQAQCEAAAVEKAPGFVPIDHVYGRTTLPGARQLPIGGLARAAERLADERELMKFARTGVAAQLAVDAAVLKVSPPAGSDTLPEISRKVSPRRRPGRRRSPPRSRIQKKSPRTPPRPRIQKKSPRTIVKRSRRADRRKRAGR